MPPRHIQRQAIINRARNELARARTIIRLKPLIDQLIALRDDIARLGVMPRLQRRAYELDRIIVETGSEEITLSDLARMLTAVKQERPIDMIFEDPVMNNTYDLIRNSRIDCDTLSTTEPIDILRRLRLSVIRWTIKEREVVARLNATGRRVARGLNRLLRSADMGRARYTPQDRELARRTIALYATVNLLYESPKHIERGDLEFLIAPIPLDYSRRVVEIERTGRAIRKLERKKSLTVAERRTLSRLKRGRLELLCPEAIRELREFNEQERAEQEGKRRIFVLDGIHASWVEERETVERTEGEKRDHLREHFPGLYRLMMKPTEEERGKRERSREIRRLVRKLDLEGVPPDFYVPLINRGERDFDRIVRKFTHPANRETVEEPERNEVRVRRNGGVTAVEREEPREIVIPRRVLRRVLGELITARFRTTLRRLNGVRGELLRSNIDQIERFISAYIRYLSQPEGERGTFGTQGLVDGSLFRERNILAGANSEGWRPFALNNGTGRIVICVRPEYGEVGLFIVENNHDAYTRQLFRFDLNNLSSRVQVTVSGQEMETRIVR